jgi:hypothetical protein
VAVHEVVSVLLRVCMRVYAYKLTSNAHAHTNTASRTTGSHRDLETSTRTHAHALTPTSFTPLVVSIAPPPPHTHTHIVPSLLALLFRFAKGDMETEARESAKNAYKAAVEQGDKGLPSTSPIRLGLALNFSVFYYVRLRLRPMCSIHHCPYCTHTYNRHAALLHWHYSYRERKSAMLWY